MTIATNRRAIVKGAAWATPVVLASSAVPAFAASLPCSKVNYTQMTWGSVQEIKQGTDSPNSKNTAAVTIDGNTYNAVITAARAGGSDAPSVALELKTISTPPNPKYGIYYPQTGFPLPPFNNYWNSDNKVANLGVRSYGGTPNMMMLSMVAPTTGMDTTAPLGQDVTVTFDKPVSMVQFSVSDIDAHWVDNKGQEWGTASTTKYGYHDQIVVSANGGTVTAATNPANDIDIKQISPSSVSATSGDTFKASEAEYQSNNEVATVTFTICGPLTQFTISYYNVGAVNGFAFDPKLDASWTYLDQQVFISPLTIKANCTPCQ